jgi:hypothetical protein
VFPLMSVIIVSLYVHGGASRVAALVLLAARLLGGLAALVRERTPSQDAKDKPPKTSPSQVVAKPIFAREVSSSLTLANPANFRDNNGLSYPSRKD